MRPLAAGADEGGLTAELLSLVETLGPLGVGIAILLETVIPPIPSEIVLGAAGVLVDGPAAFAVVVLCATLGSVLGAGLLYAVGRSLGPERSRRFLRRLPLVEDSDVDRTFTWFTEHGRSAVFAGRMVPLVRSFVSVPAGVVGMPIGRFLLYTTAGSLLWNATLVALGWLARDFVQANLQYLDYAVITVLVVGVGYLAGKRYRAIRQRRPS